MPYVPLTDAGPPDFSDRYNTPLSPADELAYQRWAQIQSAVQGRDVSRDNYDYDMRGFWKAGGQFDPKNGHGGDTFKKPNHPTFSTYSQYHGADGHTGGEWQQWQGKWLFTPSETNLQMYGLPGLEQYLQRSDRDVTLIKPGALPPSTTMLDYVKQAVD